VDGDVAGKCRLVGDAADELGGGFQFCGEGKQLTRETHGTNFGAA